MGRLARKIRERPADKRPPYKNPNSSGGWYYIDGYARPPQEKNVERTRARSTSFLAETKRLTSNRWTTLERTHQCRDDQQYEEHEEENLRNFRSRSSDAGEAEQARDDGDNEE
jgi:hypothetical protein